MEKFRVAFTNKDKAALVVGRSQKEIEKDGFVTVGSVKHFIGLETTYEDERQGWSSLEGLEGKQTDGGYFVTFSPIQPIQQEK